MLLKIGEWVAIDEDGIRECSTGVDVVSYNTKKEAIQEIQFSKMDARNTPKVKRIRKGVYEYFPKDCDYGTFGESFLIKQVTNDNLEELEEMAQWALSDERWKS